MVQSMLVFEVGFINTFLYKHVYVLGMLLEPLESNMVLHTPMCIIVFLSNLSFFTLFRKKKERKKKRRSNKEKHMQLHAHVIIHVAWVLHK